jgi:Tol biopolymer transport system component
MSCCWSPDGKYIAVANWSSSTFQIFEFTGATPVYSGGVSPGTNQTECSWSPDGKYVAVVLAGTSDSINVYSFSGGALTLNASASTANNPYSCSWSPDGRYLAVTSNNDNVLQVFSFSDGSVTQVGSNASTGGSSFPISCAWSPNGKYIALVNYSGDTLQIYEFSGGTPLKIGSNISTGSGSTPVSCCWSPNGRCLAVSCDATSVSLLEIFGVNYNANTYAQPMTNSIIWGNSTLGDSYNLDINVLSGARVEITGNVYHDVA